VLRYSNHFLVRRSRVGPSGTLQIGEKIEPGLPTTPSAQLLVKPEVGTAFHGDR
jgi:hypothetical protein